LSRAWPYRRPLDIGSIDNDARLLDFRTNDKLECRLHPVEQRLAQGGVRVMPSGDLCPAPTLNQEIAAR
jgi:hypothetical protein